MMIPKSEPAAIAMLSAILEGRSRPRTITINNIDNPAVKRPIRADAQSRMAVAQIEMRAFSILSISIT
nr:MAG TPA: hypothetical protein [Caudoviricetes sp.]